MHTRLCLTGGNLVCNPNGTRSSQIPGKVERTIPNQAQSYQPGEAMCRCAPPPHHHPRSRQPSKAERCREERRERGLSMTRPPGSVGTVKVSINSGAVSCATAASEKRGVGLRQEGPRGPVSGGPLDGRGPISTSPGFKTEERGK